MASATGYRLIGQVAVTGFAVLIHACTPCISRGVVSWPPLFRGLSISATADLRVSSCFARVLGGNQSTIACGDPAVTTGGTLCLVAYGACTVFGGSAAQGVELNAGESILLGSEFQTISLSCHLAKTINRSKPCNDFSANSAGVLLISVAALQAAQTASCLPPFKPAAAATAAAKL